jgi:CheY-like chemotaxis protein
MALLHGCRLSAYSEGEAFGSKFVLEIPFTTDAAPVHARRSAVEAIPCCFRLPFAPSAGRVMSAGAANMSLNSMSNINLNRLIESNRSVNIRAVMSPTRQSLLLQRYQNFVQCHTSRVMIVDDSSTVRRMTCLMLERKFEEVVVAEDGDVAVSIVQSRLAGDASLFVDVILMDFVMPRMNGAVATKAIRDIGYAGLIIGVTGNALPDDIQAFVDAGVNKVLIKPVNIVMLRQTFEGICPFLFCYAVHYVCNFPVPYRSLQSLATSECSQTAGTVFLACNRLKGEY